MSLASYLDAVPKAELHVHLEGSVAPATLLALARANRVELPAADAAGLARWFVFRDFPHFAEVYQAISRCLRSADDYELVVAELARALRLQNVGYAEVTTTPALAHTNGLASDAYLDGLCRGRERARRESGVIVNWVFDIVRSIPDRSRREMLADLTTRLAIEARAAGVVALGLGAQEQGFPPEPFESWFERGRAAGLHSAPHAGETAGPESIWGALRALSAERIGHGVRALEDPDLVAHLVRCGIPLEVCPTSNVCLGVCPDLAHHPLPALLAAGLQVTIGSDDPPLFATDLRRELGVLVEYGDLDLPGIDRVLLAGVEHSFLEPAAKGDLLARYQAEMHALRSVHLGSS